MRRIFIQLALFLFLQAELVISDVQMRQWMGLYAAAGHQTKSSVICAEIAAYSEVDKAVTAMRAGTNDYLPRPFIAQPADAYQALLADYSR